jgi:hypothetical protein
VRGDHLDEQQRSDDAEDDEQFALEGRGDPFGYLQRLEAGVERQEGEDAARQCEHGVEPPVREPSDEGVPEHPEGHGDDADEQADERERSEQFAGDARRLVWRFDVVVNRRPVTEDQRRLDVPSRRPVVGDPDRRRLHGAQRPGRLGAVADLVAPVRVVDKYLFDSDRRRPAVDDVERDGLVVRQGRVRDRHVGQRLAGLDAGERLDDDEEADEDDEQDDG